MEEKKFKADNGPIIVYWVAFTVLLLGFVIYGYIFYMIFALLLLLSVTIKEYAITELNFLEVRFVLKIFIKSKRIAIGDIVGLKKQKKNQLRLDLVRGFEILRVKESEIDALIAELHDRNPRIKIV
jgi:hypothetical protein